VADDDAAFEIAFAETIVLQDLDRS
jgi:hypothetical protein